MCFNNKHYIKNIKPSKFSEIIKSLIKKVYIKYETSVEKECDIINSLTFKDSIKDKIFRINNISQKNYKLLY